MKARLYIFSAMLVFLGVMGLSSNTFAWDFPLDIDVIAIQFDSTGCNTTYDIRVNATTDLLKPEYSVGHSRNNKFACKINSTPTVWVNFYCNSAPDVYTSLTIDAIDVFDGQWNLADKAVMFNGGGGSIADQGNPINFVTFQTGDGTSVASTIQRDNYFEWNWRVVAVGGVPRTPYNIANTDHYYYTVLDTPQAPMEEPWTEVLEKACTWADGASSVSEIIAGITSGAYNSNFKNYSAGVTHTSPPDLYLTNLFNDTWADCRDMSAVVQVFSNALGVSYYNVGYQRIDGPFRTKSIDPIGNPTWQAITWNFHQVGWYNNSVYDAALRVDESTPRIPVGENINGSYKDDLYDENHPDTEAWDPQGGSYLSGTVY